MTDAESTYWTVVAQVLPVLGLALVLEARALVQAFQQHASSMPGGGVLVRRWQLFLLTVSGLSIAYGLLRALTSLARDESPGTFEATLVQVVAVPLAIGLLLINPLLAVVFASEAQQWMRRVLESSPKARFDHWRILRGAARLQASVARLRSEVGSGLRETEALDAQLQATVDAAEAAGVGHDELAPAREHLRKGVALVDSQRRRHRSLIVQELNCRLYCSEIRAVLAEARLHHPHVEVTGDPVLGVVSARAQSAWGQAPDDGGFLSDQLVTLRLPKFPVDGELIVTDPADFYTED